MSDEASRRRLGRGLAALIGDIDRPEAPEKPTAVADREVPVELIGPNPRNPRRNFTETDLIDLTASVKQHGIVQPVVVRPSPTQPGRFEIIAGERRWRAAQRAGLANVPVIVREVDDRTSLELAIVENVQRADLNPLEEALGYQQLIDEHDYVQNDLAQIIGKSRSHVANTLRLLRLPPPVRDMLVDGSLSAGHARTLITAPDPAALARKIVAQGLSVRQAEALAQDDGRARPSKVQPQEDGKDADTRALEQQLSNATGLKISVVQRGEAGELRIVYKTIDQLEEVCRLLTR